MIAPRCKGESQALRCSNNSLSAISYAPKVLSLACRFFARSPSLSCILLPWLFHQHHCDCTMDSASAVLSESLDPAEANTLVALSKSSKIPYTTLWHRAHGRPSLQDKARGQQYLTPSEEEALVQYLLRMSRNGFPIPVKYLRSLAHVIACQRASIFQAPAASQTIRPPGKN
jgi:hypothetical protein